MLLCKWHSSYYAYCRQIERWYLLTRYIQMAIVLKTDRSTTCSRFPVAKLRIRNATVCPFLRIIGYSSWRRVNAAECFIVVGHTTQEGVRLVNYNSDWWKKWQLAVFNQSEAGNETPALLKFTRWLWWGRASQRQDFSFPPFVYIKVLLLETQRPQHGTHATTPWTNFPERQA